MKTCFFSSKSLVAVSVFFVFFLQTNSLAAKSQIFRSRLFPLEKGSLEEALFKDTSDGQLNRVSFELACLIASGIHDQSFMSYIKRIDNYQNRISLETSISNKQPAKKAEIILSWLHQNALLYYTEEACSLDVLLSTGRYNCVSSTILLYILGERFNLSLKGLQTHDHVCAILLDGKRKLEIQTTTPYGARTQHISKNSRNTNKTPGFPRETGKLGLIASIYYNKGVLTLQDGKKHKALSNFCRAYELDPDYPGLEVLVVSLFCQVGNIYFEKSKYQSSIQLMKEGLKFARSNSSKSLRATLINNISASYGSWTQKTIEAKNWSKARNILRKGLNNLPRNSILLSQLRYVNWKWIESYSEQRKWNKAIQIYNESQKNLPDDDILIKQANHIYNNWGLHLLDDGHYEKALTVLRKGKRLSEDPVFLHNIKCVYAKKTEQLLNEGKTNQAFLWLKKGSKETGDKTFLSLAKNLAGKT
ncbi:MAG: tetratricopeptide repeat protein [Candidatus Theseobacter exili]|nr:tetratricopeptide repeat protein [Candidatus Theseobacter exili]